MTAYTQDSKFLASLDVQNWNLYLQSSGWKHLKDDINYSAWELDRGNAIIILPFKENPTYSYLVKQVLEKLSEVENRSQLEIAREIKYIDSDIVGLVFDSIQNSLGNTIKILSYIRDLITLAAHSVLDEDKKTQDETSSKRAKNFAESLLLEENIIDSEKLCFVLISKVGEIPEKDNLLSAGTTEENCNRKYLNKMIDWLDKITKKEDFRIDEEDAQYSEFTQKFEELCKLSSSKHPEIRTKLSPLLPNSPKLPPKKTEKMSQTAD